MDVSTVFPVRVEIKMLIRTLTSSFALSCLIFDHLLCTEWAIAVVESLWYGIHVPLRNGRARTTGSCVGIKYEAPCGEKLRRDFEAAECIK